MSLPCLARVQILPRHWTNHAHYLVLLAGQRKHGSLFANIVLTKAIFPARLPPFDFCLGIPSYLVLSVAIRPGRMGGRISKQPVLQLIKEEILQVAGCLSQE